MRSLSPIRNAASFLVLSFLTSATTPAFSQTGSVVPVGPAFERVLDDVPISSVGVIQGAMVRLPARPADINKVSVRLPASSVAALLCVQIKSQDGRYEARRAFSISGVAPGDYQVLMGLRHASFAARYPGSALALIAAVDDTCPGYRSNTKVIVTGWSPSLWSETSLVLFVNVGQNDAYASLVDRAGKMRAIQCGDLNNSIPKVAFGKSCSIPLAELSGESKVMIDEYSFGDFVRSTSVLVANGK